jgi:hypothetical protein
MPDRPYPATVDPTPQDIFQLRAETAELRRLLDKHQWSGLTPLKSQGACPECCGSKNHGHRPGCAIAAAVIPAD